MEVFKENSPKHILDSHDFEISAQFITLASRYTSPDFIYRAILHNPLYPTPIGISAGWGIFLYPFETFFEKR